MTKRRALITGITGQDGGYLAEFLLSKGYEVYGMYRRCSVDDHLKKIEHLKERIHLVQGDLLDSYSLDKVVKETQPDEVYNLGAQSQVAVSFHQPIVTREINWYGVERLFKSLEENLMKFKFYQASTSELFGKALETPQTEETPFNPVSPYASAKFEAYNFIQRKRKEGFFACNGILFNHESPRRGIEFVTRKITDGAARIKLGLPQRVTGKDYLELGNLDSKRDWGFAGDYVEAMWLILQKEKPSDYVISTGENHSIREFVGEAFNLLDLPLTWEGEGINEKGKFNGKTLVKVNPEFYRPAEVSYLLGNSQKAKKELGWEPKVKFNELIRKMVESDLEKLKSKKF